MKLTLDEVAEKVGCSKPLIVRLIVSGKLPATNLGTKLRSIWRVNEVDLNKLLNGSTEVDAAKLALQQSKPEWLGGKKTSA